MSEPFIGEIKIFAGNFAPRNWAFCDGQLLPIAQNTALFSIFGTTYGGDGRTSFGLPNLQGRGPMHQGRGPGLTQRRLGQQGGVETVSLTETQMMPAHKHDADTGSLHVNTSAANTADPRGNSLAAANVFSSVAADVELQNSFGDGIGNTGGGQAHENMPPFLTLSFIIALQGTFPSRS